MVADASLNGLTRKTSPGFTVTMAWEHSQHHGRLGRHYLMGYGPRNERTSEQNQDTNIWQYTYDELLRLKQQTDPNGTVRTPTYDNSGRVLYVDFNTGRRDSFNYDNNDNPTSISRRFSSVTTALQLIYDSLDRVVEQDDALGKTVLYGHDPLGRVTSITYPVESSRKHLRCARPFDETGGLGGRQMNYAYDPADRLIYRSYPNGVVQSNVFDTAGGSLAFRILLPARRSQPIAPSKLP